MAVKFFDEHWYLARNPDVAEAVQSGAISAEQHFEQFGVHEGRSPSPLFDASYYLLKNPDVAYAVQFGLTTPYAHFEQFGHLEEREASPYFDVQGYLENNSDVSAAVEAGGMSAYEHFQQYGMDENRSSLDSFDAGLYLTANPDVAASVEAGNITATRHFMTYGVAETRALNPVVMLGAYLTANPDVAGAVSAGQTTALAHLLTYGATEGRDLGNGVSGADFVNDPAYQAAVAAGHGDDALARMSDVAPFLPSFNPPAGFQLPGSWPIPQDFVPAPGVQLTVPEGWVPDQPVQLPSYFEQPFVANISPEGVVSFASDVTGEIHVVNMNGQAAFSHGGFISAGTVPPTAAVQLGAEQVLVGLYSDIAGMSIGGEGAVRAEGTAEADTIDATQWSAVNLTVDGKAGDDVITIGDTQTAVGGDGADTFVIAATAGTPSVITVADYDINQGDIIDASKIAGFNPLTVEVRGAEHDGTGWQWGPGYMGDSVGVWLTGEAANIEITGARYETMKFALPDIPGFDGYNLLQVNIANGGVLRAGDDAAEILRGGDGGQILVGGAKADILSGGQGNDFFVFTGGSSRLDNMDRIVDLSAGQDTLVSHTAVNNLMNAGTLANLQAGTISAALNATNFGANAGAAFSAEGRTFVVLNDGVAGFDAATDTIVEVTGAGDLTGLTIIGLPDLGASGVAGLQEMV